MKIMKNLRHSDVSGYTSVEEATVYLLRFGEKALLSMTVTVARTGV